MTLLFDRRAIMVLLAAAGLPLRVAGAAEASKPILRITGMTKSGTEMHLDREAIATIGWSTIETATPWFGSRSRFEGVPLKSLLRTVGAADATQIHVHALDGYAADISAEDIAHYGPLLALRRDGVDMAVRDKGPLLVVYPFDAYPELRNPRYYGRSIWHVDAMVIG